MMKKFNNTPATAALLTELLKGTSVRQKETAHLGRTGFSRV